MYYILDQKYIFIDIKCLTFTYFKLGVLDEYDKMMDSAWLLWFYGK